MCGPAKQLEREKGSSKGDSLCLLSEEEKDKSSWEHMDSIVLNEYFKI